LIMLGSPGSGKTMLSRRLPTILPPLTTDESLETTRIYSALGRLASGESLLTARPFRSPHHTISDAGMVGGGTTPQPGEISMAHNGVLFLDELPEFNRKSLESLRQPLEEGRVTISRALCSVSFPARFVLVAAMNPCPCGYLGDSQRVCKCLPLQVEKYLGRVSGPLLDRIDMHLEIPSVRFDDLSSTADGTSSASMRSQVLHARAVQKQRFGDGESLNGRMNTRHIRKYAQLGPESKSILKNAMDDLGLSARAHDRILRLSRTIADLASRDSIDTNDLLEAINYRTMDRKLWSR
jgi:magnesium chelatase family protein